MTQKYEDSSDFTSDLDQLHTLLFQAQAIIQKPAFKDWMKETDKNYLSDCEVEYKDVKDSIEETYTAVDDFRNRIIDLDS